jgi:hypothetical protein
MNAVRRTATPTINPFWFLGEIEPANSSQSTLPSDFNATGPTICSIETSSQCTVRIFKSSNVISISYSFRSVCIASLGYFPAMIKTSSIIHSIISRRHYSHFIGGLLQFTSGRCSAAQVFSWRWKLLYVKMLVKISSSLHSLSFGKTWNSKKAKQAVTERLPLLEKI